MDPELVQKVELAVDDHVRGGKEEGQGEVERLEKITTCSNLPFR